jgi:hypothetical protein
MRNVKGATILCMLMLAARPLQASVERQLSHPNTGRLVLSQEQASHFARLTLK